MFFVPSSAPDTESIHLHKRWDGQHRLDGTPGLLQQRAPERRAQFNSLSKAHVDLISGNSLKYTRTGSVTVTLSTKNAESRSVVELVIQDTGIGMSQDFIANDLFTPYKQANSTSLGLGLGLSIVKQVARDLNAVLDVQSKPNKGTRTSVKMNVAWVKAAFKDDDDEDDRLLMDAISKLRPQSFYMLTPETSRLTSSLKGGSVSHSVLKTAEQWLQGDVVSSPHINLESAATVCGIEEAYLLQLVKDKSLSFTTKLSELATQGVQILVFASSTNSLSHNISFEDFTSEPIFLHQP